MTSEEMELAIGFLLEHHAKLSADVQSLVQTVAAQGEQAEADRAEMREGFNNLIVANEVTRDLAEKTAALAIQTSQRVTNLENG